MVFLFLGLSSQSCNLNFWSFFFFFFLPVISRKKYKFVYTACLMTASGITRGNQLTYYLRPSFETQEHHIPSIPRRISCLFKQDRYLRQEVSRPSPTPHHPGQNLRIPTRSTQIINNSGICHLCGIGMTHLLKKNIMIYKFDFSCSVTKSFFFFSFLAKYLWHEKWNGFYHSCDPSRSIWISKSWPHYGKGHLT